MPPRILKAELIKMAVNKGMAKKEANKLLVPELKTYLGLAPAKPRAPKAAGILNGRPCGPSKSSKNPNAYTKEELVEIAANKFNITKTALSKLTKDKLCDALSSNIAPDLPQRKKGKGVALAGPKIKFVKKVTMNDGREKKKKSSGAPKKVQKKIKKKSSLDNSKISFIRPLVKLPKPTVVIPVESKVRDCITRSKMKLKDHQIRVVEHMRKNRGLIVAFGVGSGKTLTAVTASQCYLQDNPKGRIIVVTPTSLQENFKKEMKGYGVKDKDKKYEFYTLQKFATTYDKKKCGDNIMLIIDEAHNLRTDVKQGTLAKAKAAAKAKGKKPPINRADVAIRCAKTADKVLLLTATAIYNNPRDMANLVAMVRGENPLKQSEFAKILSDKDKFEKYFGCTITFYSNPKDENYPSFKENYVDIEMDAKYYKEYKAVEERNSNFLQATNPWRFLVGVRQASNALASCPKCEWVMNKIKEGKKTLIYSSFLAFGIEKLQSMLKKENIPFVEVKGSMSQKTRGEAVAEYNSNKVNVLFITKAGGEGLDLKGTRNVIIMESSWNRPNEEQIIGRAVRYRSHSHLPKSEHHVDVYHLIMVKPRGKAGADENPSADEMMRTLTEEKDKVNAVFIKKLIPLAVENNNDC